MPFMGYEPLYYAMLYKYGGRTGNFWGRFVFILFQFYIFWGVSNTTIIRLCACWI